MKRFLAMAIATMMTVTSANMVFAAVDTNGDVKIEYDDSKDIEFDSVNVPTIATGTFNFSLDPGKILNSYDSTTYNSSDSVYFTKVVPASFKAKGSATLYKKDLTEVSAANWSSVVNSVDSDTGGITLDSTTDYYVWTPDTASTAYTNGKPGKEVKLTGLNITNWFDVATDGTLTLKPDYMAGDNVCDGKIYKYTYTAIGSDGITDSVLTPIADYVTLSNDGKSIAAYGNLYKDNTGAVATDGEVEFTPASTESVGTTTPITIVNKSTKKKTVTATVTMSDVSGIDFKPADTSLGTDTNASMYIAVTNGSKTEALAASEDGTTATAKYEVPLNPATIRSTVYQTTVENDVTGGHKYEKFNSPNTTYTSDTFYLTAEISGTTDDAKAAWKVWAQAKNADDNPMPAINVVYDVTDFTDETAVASNKIAVSGKTITVEDSADATITSVTIGGTAATEDTDYTTDLTDGVEVTLKDASASDRTVVIKYTINGVKYSATATVAGVPTISALATMTKSSDAEFTLAGLGALTVKSVVLKNCHTGKGALTTSTLTASAYSVANGKLTLDHGSDEYEYRFANESQHATDGTVDIEVTLSDDTVLTSKLKFVNE